LLDLQKLKEEKSMQVKESKKRKSVNNETYKEKDDVSFEMINDKSRKRSFVDSQKLPVQRQSRFTEYKI